MRRSNIGSWRDCRSQNRRSRYRGSCLGRWSCFPICPQDRVLLNVKIFGCSLWRGFVLVHSLGRGRRVYRSSLVHDLYGMEVPSSIASGATNWEKVPSGWLHVAERRPLYPCTCHSTRNVIDWINVQFTRISVNTEILR